MAVCIISGKSPYRKAPMIKRLLAVLALSLPLLAAFGAAATPASADPVERTCYTPHVKGFDTVEMCIWLPTIE